MKRLFQLLSSMSRWERWTLGVLAAAFVLSGVALLRGFYLSTTMVVPSTGGTYIEGSVGELHPLNPWFTVQNDVNRDVVSLVFAGLLRYDPQTRKIADDLATMQVSKDNKIFTLHLKDNIYWQDSTKAEPHPVTADDVLFTFQTIQNPDFPNLLLQQNFRGVKIEKTDDRTVRFTLDTSYGFFPSNLTLGLLPRKSFEGFPVAKYDQQLDFAFNPVGAGPYKIKSIVQTELSSEVTLERFRRSIPPAYHLDRIVFRLFPDYSTLLSDLPNLHGVRLVPRNDAGNPMVPKRYVASNYYLPQYVALFFNMDRAALKDQKLRLGLELGTDKKAIADALHESVLVDTPLLELEVSDWHYRFDANAAQGALLASKWNIPERLRLQKVLEENGANKQGPLQLPVVALVQPLQGVTFSGSYQMIPRGSLLNGMPLQDIPTASGSWAVHLPLLKGSGALKLGDNMVTLTSPKDGHVIDSFYTFVATDPETYARALEDRRVASLFVESKAGQIDMQSRISIWNLFLDRGLLRLRQSGDAYSVRQNEKGQPLELTLLTSPAPATYKQVAALVASQWAQLGVKVKVVIPATRDAFENRLLHRDYDILLFGQSLLDNLDSYPYWHSSGMQKLTGQEKDLRRDAYNLSQYSSFKADTLLETIRSTNDEKERQQSLQQLSEVLKEDVPAIFLYSPLYTYAHHQNILGIDLGSLSLHSDRFLSLDKWYIRENRVFKPGMGWSSFFGWLAAGARNNS